MGKHFERMYSSTESLTNEAFQNDGLVIDNNDTDDVLMEDDLFSDHELDVSRTSSIVSFISSYVSFGLLKLYDVLPLRSRQCRSG